MSHARLALLHLCDSLFPVGAFAHSDGLEGAVAASRVRTSDDLGDWLQATLAGVLASCEGPALRDAVVAVRTFDTRALLALDAELNAMRTSQAGRDASRSTGTRLLKTWQHLHPTAPVGELLATRAPFTFPVAFGVVSHVASIPLVEAIEGYCYLRLASTVSAAMRLMPVGQLEAHKALSCVIAEVPSVASTIAAASAPPRSFMPFMDITSMSHQYVRSRLFRS